MAPPAAQTFTAGDRVQVVDHGHPYRHRTGRLERARPAQDGRPETWLFAPEPAGDAQWFSAGMLRHFPRRVDEPPEPDWKAEVDRLVDAGRFEWPAVIPVKSGDGREWRARFFGHKVESTTAENAVRVVLQLWLATVATAIFAEQFDVWLDQAKPSHCQTYKCAPSGELKTYTDFSRQRFNAAIAAGERRRVYDVSRKLYFDVEIAKATKKQVVYRVLGNPADYQATTAEFRSMVAEACLRETGDELRAGAILEAT